MPAKGDEKYDVEKMKEALLVTGSMAAAAHAMECDRGTVSVYCKKYPELQEALDESEEETVDFAVTGLKQNVMRGHPGSIFYTLSTLGKGRGYTKREEVTGKDGGPIEHKHKYSHLTREETMAEMKKRGIPIPEDIDASFVPRSDDDDD